ncbi:DUF5009 domain-containing protein [Prolixibacteraceae bacterium JC049]|nr:DUF5009 domain-containing protein [Prolixibacteraceae bacterium JC049]
MTSTQKSERLLSLDTLRGFDMFWIIGGDMFFRALAKTTDLPLAHWWAKQMHHVSWEGFHAYDLVFPLFMFISGVAIPYAITSKLEKGTPKSSIYRKVIQRAVILVLLGLVYNGLFNLNFSTLRGASVLGQIGLAYLIAALIVMNTKTFKARLIWLIGILVGYGALQLAVPVPEFGAGNLTPTGCINGYIDQMLLPGRLYGKTFDPEGLMCIVSASAITLMGALGGALLRSKQLVPQKKTLVLLVTGASLIITASLLSGWYPIIKSAWTSTFNLLTGGISFVLLAIFYQVIDVWKYQRWTFFFRVIGLNSITIYMAIRVFKFKSTSDFFMGGLASLTGDFQTVVLIIGMLALEWLFLYFLYKRNIFLKV